MVVLVFLAAGRLRNDTRASIAYLVEANAAVTGYRDLAQRFQGQILLRLPVAQREDIELLMDQYVADAASEAAGLHEMSQPASTAAAAAALDLALTSWEEGLQSFTQGLFAVVDYPNAEASVEELSTALAQLQVGDLAYERFLDAVEELGTRIDLPVEFPEVAFLPARLGTLRHVAGIIAVVEDAQGMALRRDLEISAVKLEPQEVGTDDNGDLILPATEALLVRASVGNRGNENERDIRVSITLQSSDGSILYQETVDLDSLEPRGSTTVDFSALPVVAGERYTILVAVTVLPNDVDTSNNVRQIQIRVNEPS
ncbi:MAG: hypothetical protein GWP04_00490 [Gammaproteobacteria bacterium]|nr:hypothetical protein [Gammaproteobacteria bacterium]